MAIDQGLMKQIRNVLGSTSLKVFPVGRADDIARGILSVPGYSKLGKAVRAAFGIALIAASLGTSSAAYAQGVGYDANVYGQAQEQVMQVGSAVRMNVVAVRAVQIQVAAQQVQSGGSNAIAGYAVEAATGAIGGLVGNQIGGSSQNQTIHEVGAVLGGLLGAVGGNVAFNALTAPPAAKMVAGTEITLANPNNNQLSVITQAGNMSFSPGEHVLVTTVGGNTRVVPDVSQAVSQNVTPVGYGVQQTGAQENVLQGVSNAQQGAQSAARSLVNVKAGFEKEILHTGSMIGLTLDPHQVAELLDIGGPQQGMFSGTVKAVDNDSGVLYLSSGRGAGVALPIDMLSRVPAVNSHMTVRFENGKGIVSGVGVQHAQVNSVGRG